MTQNQLKSYAILPANVKSCRSCEGSLFVLLFNSLGSSIKKPTYGLKEGIHHKAIQLL